MWNQHLTSPEEPFSTLQQVEKAVDGYGPAPHQGTSIPTRKAGRRPCFLPSYSPLIPLPHRVLFDLCHSSCFRETEAQAACFVHPIFKISIAFCFFRSSQAAHKSVDAPYVAERGIGRRASECWQRSSNSSCYFNAIACSWKWKSFSVSSSLEENFSF